LRVDVLLRDPHLPNRVGPDFAQFSAEQRSTNFHLLSDGCYAMLKLSCLIDQVHARALAKLIDMLDYEVIRRYADSDQETYDMIFCLESIRKALKNAQNV
jgi:hypothetical protein